MVSEEHWHDGQRWMIEVLSHTLWYNRTQCLKDSGRRLFWHRKWSFWHKKGWCDPWSLVNVNHWLLWMTLASTWTNNQLVTPKFDNWMMTWQLASHQPLKRQHIDVALEYDLWTKVNDHWLNKINFLILLELLELLELLSNCFFVFWLFPHTWPNATSDLLIFPNELHLALVQMAFTQATIDNMAIKQGMDLLETKGWSPWSASWPTMRSRTSAKVLWHPRGMMGDLLAPHPGFAVLICVKMNLKSMNYFLRYAEEQARMFWQPPLPSVLSTSWRCIKNGRKVTKMWIPRFWGKGLAYDGGH